MTEARDFAETYPEVRRILCELLMLAEVEVQPGTLLVQDLNLDSLGFVELEFSLEEAFGIKFPDVKLSPEIFAMPLPESLAAVEAIPGGTTLFEFMKGEVLAAVQEKRRESGPADSAMTATTLDAATVADLARAVEGRVPPGLEPTTPLGSLHITALFQFVTASVMARYVEYLVAARASDGGA